MTEGKKIVVLRYYKGYSFVTNGQFRGMAQTNGKYHFHTYNKSKKNFGLARLGYSFVGRLKHDINTDAGKKEFFELIGKPEEYENHTYTEEQEIIPPGFGTDEE